MSELTDLIEQQMRDADAIRQKAINDLMREIGECDLNIKHYQDRRHEAEEMLAQLQPQTEPKRRPGRPPGSGKKAEAKQ